MGGILKLGEILLLGLVPLDCFVTGVLLCTELVGRVARTVAPVQSPVFPAIRPECSFVIVSWNSQAALAESLPPLLHAIQQHGGNHEIIVLDNHSTDGTDEYVRRKFPEVRLIRTDKNLYFGAGTRLGIETATRDIVVIMNSDTIVRPDFLEHLLEALREPDVFGVASQVCAADNETGYTHGELLASHIEWEHTEVPNSEAAETYPVLWLHRGLFAVDRRKYLWLGALDSLYDPLFFEDVDLSYRAWKVGWKCLLAVNSQVAHCHGLKIPDSGKGFLHQLARRNQYIFSWKNLNDLSTIASHGRYARGVRARRARIPGIGVGREVRSFLGALERLPQILLRKLVLARCVRRTDREIFARTGQPQNRLDAGLTAHADILLEKQTSEAPIQEFSTNNSLTHGAAGGRRPLVATDHLMRNIIVHYHIFKNAGSSIDRILSENFGPAWSTVEGKTPTSLLNTADLKNFLNEHLDLQAVSSHLARPPMPEGMNVLPIVMLRHPLDRAASVYLHERRAPSRVKSSEIAKVQDIRGYVKWCLDERQGRAEGGVVIRNYQVVHLSAASFRHNHIYKIEAERADLREAMEFLRALPFFGIVDNFDMSLRVLEHLARPIWPKFTAVPTAENASPDRAAELSLRLQGIRRELGEDTWQALVCANELDLELYNWAATEFRVRAMKLGISVPATVQGK